MKAKITVTIPKGYIRVKDSTGMVILGDLLLVVDTVHGAIWDDRSGFSWDIPKNSWVIRKKKKK